MAPLLVIVIVSATSGPTTPHDASFFFSVHCINVTALSPFPPAPRSRTAVFTPTAWDGSLAVRSGKLPDAGLSLEWVHGYDGVFSTDSNVYFTARVGPLFPSHRPSVTLYARPCYTQRLLHHAGGSTTRHL